MNKTEMVSELADKTGLTKKESKIIVDSFLEILKEGMVDEREVNLPPFGKFKVIERAARKGHNPQTGEELEIPAKMAPKFVASVKLKESVNE